MITVTELLHTFFAITPVRVSIKTNGGEYHSPCPKCGGEDRFLTWPAQYNGAGGYWCRQCSEKSGRPKDNIEFLIEFKGYSFKDAAKYVGRETDYRNGAMPAQKTKDTWQPIEHLSPVELWQQKAWKFAEDCHEELLKYSAGLSWLAGRGIGIETVKKYKLGWHPGEDGKDQYRARKGWGLPEELNEEGKPRALWLPVGVVIPCYIDGKIQRLRIRRTKAAIEKFGPKYYIVPGSQMNTLILEPDRKALVIVEAELDAFAIAEAAGDIVGAVALGSLANKPDAYATEKLRACLQILNALDFEPDKKNENGQPAMAGARAMDWWRENFMNCERWPVPQGKDPGEAKQAGVDLRTWIEAGLPPIMKIAKSVREEASQPQEEKPEEKPADQEKKPERQMSGHLFPAQGEFAYSRLVSVKVVELMEGVAKYAYCLRWTPEQLFQNRSQFPPLEGLEWGMVCHLQDDDAIGKITSSFIEIIRPGGGGFNYPKIEYCPKCGRGMYACKVNGCLKVTPPEGF